MYGSAIHKIDWGYVFRSYAAPCGAVAAFLYFLITHRTGRRDKREKCRPTIDLVRIDNSMSARKAVFKNNGEGAAKDIVFKNASGIVLRCPDAFLNKGVEAFVFIEAGDGIINASFMSAVNEPGHTICGYSGRSNVFAGHQAFGGEVLSQIDAQEIYEDILKKAAYADAQALLADTRAKINRLGSEHQG